MKYGDILKKLRTEKGLSQKELTDQLAINRSTYARYETSSTQPDFDTLEKLADYFNVSIDYLLGRTNNSVSYLEKTQEINVSNELNDRLTLLQNELKTSKHLTFNGEPMSEEAKEALLEAMQFGIRLIEKQKKKQVKDESEEI